jgi:uncharacterized protein (TIGR03083 family)
VTTGDGEVGGPAASPWTPVPARRQTRAVHLLGHLQAAGERFAVAIAAAGAAIDAGHAPVVPGCPGWDLRDLAVHLGGIHRWALEALTQGDPGRPPADRDHGPPAGAADLRAWFEDGTSRLLGSLAAADPARPCWGFGPPPRTAAFWQRRMPHETALHAWDAEHAIGRPAPIDPALAADGVDEVVGMFVPRQVRLRRLEPLGGALELRATDAPGWGPWRLGPDALATPPDAVVTARAETLLLVLWRRDSVDAAVAAGHAQLDGDAEAVRRVLTAPLTP